MAQKSMQERNHPSKRIRDFVAASRNEQLRILVTILGCAFISTEGLAATCTTKPGYAAAISESVLDEVVQYAVDKDMKALQSLVDSGLAFSIRGGVSVYTVDVGWTKVSFRLPGKRSVLWTVREALNC